MKQEIRVGVIGIGTVGTGVIDILQKQSHQIAQQIGVPIILKKAVDVNFDQPRAIDLSSVALSTNLDDVINDPEIDVVIELIGGLDHAAQIILESLRQGKSIITANKACIAEKSYEIFNTLNPKKSFIGFEAAVMAGVPVLRSLRQAYSADNITQITGIINGTANYILSQMTTEKSSFTTALQDAQTKGYAEADPTFDIQGIDAAHKLNILMNLAYHSQFNFHDLYIEGITKITQCDIQYAEKLGHQIKLLAISQKTSQGVEGYVIPALIPQQHILAHVNNAFNAISLQGDFAGPALMYGLGAGSHATAIGVISDLIEAGKFILHQSQQAQTNQMLPSFWPKTASIPLVPMLQTFHQYYLRLEVREPIATEKEIIKILNHHQITIRSILQDQDQENVTLIIMTETGKEDDLQKALQKINQLTQVTEPTQLLRVFN